MLAPQTRTTADEPAAGDVAAKTFAVADMHSDVILRAIDYGLDIGKDSEWAQCTIPNLERGHVTDQIFAIWVNSREIQGLEATQRALRMIDTFWQQQALYPDRIGLARSVAEADEVKASGRIAVYMFVEGGVAIADDLAILRSFYRLGVRGMTLTWMNNLPWAGSSTDKNDPEEGLDEFGRQVVQEMNRLGMVVDLSHVSDQTFWDAIKLSTDPVVVSHSCCRALSDHPRNITDDMLRALAENGGVIGINALPSYVDKDFDATWDKVADSLVVEIQELQEKHGSGTPEYRESRRLLVMSHMPEEALVTLSDYIDHIDHALQVAGEDHVGLGADFDGMWVFPVGLERPSKWQSVAQGLLDRGYSEEVVAKVMGDNVRRVLKAVLDR